MTEIQIEVLRTRFRPVNDSKFVDLLKQLDKVPAK